MHGGAGWNERGGEGYSERQQKRDSHIGEWIARANIEQQALEQLRGG